LSRTFRFPTWLPRYDAIHHRQRGDAAQYALNLLRDEYRDDVRHLGRDVALALLAHAEATEALTADLLGAVITLYVTSSFLTTTPGRALLTLALSTSAAEARKEVQTHRGGDFNIFAIAAAQLALAADVRRELSTVYGIDNHSIHGTERKQLRHSLAFATL
jgi:hypothetical protein